MIQIKQSPTFSLSCLQLLLSDYIKLAVAMENYIMDNYTHMPSFGLFSTHVVQSMNHM